MDSFDALCTKRDISYRALSKLLADIPPRYNTLLQEAVGISVFEFKKEIDPLLDAVSQHARALDTLHNQCYTLEVTKPLKEAANRSEWLSVFPSYNRACSATLQALQTLGVVLRRFSFAEDLAIMTENASETAQDVSRLLKSLKQALPNIGGNRSHMMKHNNNNNNQHPHHHHGGGGFDSGMSHNNSPSAEHLEGEGGGDPHLHAFMNPLDTEDFSGATTPAARRSGAGLEDEIEAKRRQFPGLTIHKRLLGSTTRTLTIHANDKTFSFEAGEFPQWLTRPLLDHTPSTFIRVLGQLEAENQSSDLHTVLQDAKVLTGSVRKLQKDVGNASGSNGAASVAVSAKITAEANAFVTAQLRQQGSVVQQHAILQFLQSSLLHAAQDTRALIVVNCGSLCDRLSDSLVLWNTAKPMEKDPQLLGLTTSGEVGRVDRVVRLTDIDRQMWVKELMLSVSKRMPLRRHAMPVAIVLFGGRLDDVHVELLSAVKKRWMIYIVEGSGGFADVLAMLVRRVESVCPNPSLDDYRRVLAGGEATAAEILIHGRYRLIPIGMSTDEFRYCVRTGLRDDDTLKRAWTCFSLWDYNSTVYLNLTTSLQLVILILGMLTTALSVVACLVQLLYPQLSESDNEMQFLSRLFVAINLLLIILPIFTSLFQAWLFKMDPARKWVTLRRCSQLMLREIFMYRTRTRSYSLSSVTKGGQIAEAAAAAAAAVATAATATAAAAAPGTQAANNAATGAVTMKQQTYEVEHDVTGAFSGIDDRLLDSWGDAGDGYTSCEDLLYRRLAALSEEIGGEMSDTPMRSLERIPVPPPMITVTGDDAYSLLGPEDYIRYRLEPALRSYEVTSSQLRKRFNVLTLSVYVFGSVGTMLAAVAVYGSIKEYNLQFWVALTTSMQNALSRYVDYSRVEHLMREHSKAKEELMNVTTWWAQLQQQPGVAADSQFHRDALVGKVETSISREVEQSGSQMKNLVGRMKRASSEQAAEDAAMLQDLQTHDGFSPAQLQALGLDSLSPENIAAALTDPNSAISVKIIQAIKRIEELTERKLIEDEDVLEKMRSAQQLAATGVMVAGAVQHLVEGGSVEDIPVDIANILRDPRMIPRFHEIVAQLQAALPTDTRLVASRQLLLDITGMAHSELRAQLERFPQRKLLAIAKMFFNELVLSKFEESLTKINVGLYNLVNTRAEAEQLIGDLGAVASSNWKGEPIDDVLKKIKDEGVRQSIEKLGEATVRAMLKRAERFFSAEEDPSTTLLGSIVDHIAAIDVEESLVDPQSTVDRALLRARLLAHNENVAYMAKSELLNLLPAQFRASTEICNQSSRQLRAYLNFITNGSTEFVLMDCAFQSILAVGGAAGNPNGSMVGGGEDLLPPSLKSPEGRCRFFLALCGLDDEVLYNAPRDVLLRRLSVSPYFANGIATELRDFEHLREVCAMVSGVISTDPKLQMFIEIDRHCVSINLQQTIPDLKDRLALIDVLVTQFDRAQSGVSSATAAPTGAEGAATAISSAIQIATSTASILQNFPKRLASVLTNVADVTHLLELVNVASRLSSDQFSLLVVARCLRNASNGDNDDQVDAGDRQIGKFRGWACHLLTLSIQRAVVVGHRAGGADLAQLDSAVIPAGAGAASTFGGGLKPAQILWRDPAVRSVLPDAPPSDNLLDELEDYLRSITGAHLRLFQSLFRHFDIMKLLEDRCGSRFERIRVLQTLSQPDVQKALAETTKRFLLTMDEHRSKHGAAGGGSVGAQRKSALWRLPAANASGGLQKTLQSFAQQLPAGIQSLALPLFCMMDEEVICNGPKVLFDSLAVLCSSFNLTALFPQYSHQYLLILMLSSSFGEKSIFSNNNTNPNNNNNNTESSSAFGPSSAEALTKPYETVEMFQPIFPALGRLRKEDLREVMTSYQSLLHCPVVQLIVERHRMIPPTMVSFGGISATIDPTQFTNKSSNNVSEQEVLPNQTLSFGPGEAEANETMFFARVAAHDIRQKLLFHSDFVYQALFRFDKGIFSSSLAEERNRRLSLVLDEEEMVSSVAKFSVEQVKDLFNALESVQPLPKIPSFGVGSVEWDVLSVGSLLAAGF